MEIDKNQKPIMRLTTRAGASFVIALSPTGLNRSSPTVCNRYVNESHSGLTRPFGPAIWAAGTSTANPSPTQTRPRANFVGLEGLRLPKAAQIHGNTGPNPLTRLPRQDCNQLDGNS